MVKVEWLHGCTCVWLYNGRTQGFGGLEKKAVFRFCLAASVAASARKNVTRLEPQICARRHRREHHQHHQHHHAITALQSAVLQRCRSRHQAHHHRRHQGRNPTDRRPAPLACLGCALGARAPRRDRRSSAVCSRPKTLAPQRVQRTFRLVATHITSLFPGSALNRRSTAERGHARHHRGSSSAIAELFLSVFPASLLLWTGSVCVVERREREVNSILGGGKQQPR